jgi:drug/metabolite transporter (DMT)-like permease
MTTGSRPLARILVGAILISFSPVLVRLADIAPTPAGFYRMAVGGVVLAAITFARGHRWNGGRGYLSLCVLAGVVFAADLAFWHRSIVFVGPGLATILGNTQVFILAAFGIVVLRERASPRLLVGVPLAVVGLFLIFGREWDALDADYHWGVVFGLLTALSYASYLLALRAARRRAPEIDAMATVAAISLLSAGILAAAVVFEGASFRVPNLTTAGLLLAYGLLIQVVGWVLISSGLPHVDTSRAGLVLLLQPALAFVWDLLFFARPTSAVEMGGALLTLGAIYLGLTGHVPREPVPTDAPD